MKQAGPATINLDVIGPPLERHAVCIRFNNPSDHHASMPSLYLNRLSHNERSDLLKELHEHQAGNCFICGKAIDLLLHKDTIDIDHVTPISLNGPDNPSNFAVTHDSCNRGKQDSDLRVARIIARFDDINQSVSVESRAANLGDILKAYRHTSFPFPIRIENGVVFYSMPGIGKNAIQSVPLYTDALSGFRFFFAQLPIQYIEHDGKLNPRAIGPNIKKLIKEFHSKRPQLHVALGWINTADGDTSAIRIFDGQHKAAAQIMLGAQELPVRVFVDPDVDVLLAANTIAGTTLRQVAFDKSVQRNLGSALLADRMQRYRADCRLADDSEAFSEIDLQRHFKGESREMKKYILDWIRSSITHHKDNKLRDFIEYGGRSTDFPLSYSTVEKTFYSFFIGSELLSTRFNHRAEEGLNPRALEIEQIVSLMNTIAEEIFIGKFDPSLGTSRIENKISKGEDIPEPHLIAYRMAKEEIIYNWLRYIKQVVQMSFVNAGIPFDENAPLQKPLPPNAWNSIRNFVRSLKRLPIWVNRDMSTSVFGGKRNNDFWKQIFEEGETPDGQKVLGHRIDLIKMIQSND
jgi:5-methylcytosine-specific restriction endonuclease McrA